MGVAPDPGSSPSMCKAAVWEGPEFLVRARAQRQRGSRAGRPAGPATADSSLSVIAKPTNDPTFQFE
jgi:hypothetical protein